MNKVSNCAVHNPRPPLFEIPFAHNAKKNKVWLSLLLSPEFILYGADAERHKRASVKSYIYLSKAQAGYIDLKGTFMETLQH